MASVDQTLAHDAALGRDLLFRYLVDLDIPYIFGNPGTTELPLIDGCNDYASVDYVLALHEDIAVAQAIGYARGSGKIGVVNLHVTPGVAHGLGNIYNAFRARVPLLIVAGQHHSGLNVYDPILTADLGGLMRPFTKWSYEVSSLPDLPIALQRAFKELTTPPYGPVFLSIATDLFLAEYPDPPGPRLSKIGPTRALESAVEHAATLLAEAANPLILAGDGVGLNGAWEDMVALAESLDAVVLTEGYATLWNFPSNHRLFAGPMPNLATEMRKQLDDVDVLLTCGVTCQAPVSRYDGGGPLVPWRVRTITVDDSPWEIGKNEPVEVGLLGDVKANLAALAAAVRRRSVVGAQREHRRAAAEARCRHRVDQWADRAARALEANRLSADLVAAELRDRLPHDAIFVDESISNRPSFVNILQFRDPLSYFNVNGLSLGYSPAAAVGIHQALPHRKVVNVVGDGSLMYYPQALWNAAADEAPILFVVLKNGTYRVLSLIIDRMGGPWGAEGLPVPGLSLDASTIDFVALAGAQGVPGERAADPAQLRAALEKGLTSEGPYLVEVVLDQR